MKSKKNLLKKSLLYVIINSSNLSTPSLLNDSRKAIRLGGDIIQLRNKYDTKSVVLKQAIGLRRFLSKTNSLLIINDYLDIAKISDADGIHLGQDDLPVKAARQLLGKSKIIGISCHSVKQAIKAQEDGADYIGIGPIFATATKPNILPIGLDIIKIVTQKISIPFFAIGGIDKTNLGDVLNRGAKRVAVVRAFKQADVLKRILNQNIHNYN